VAVYRFSTVRGTRAALVRSLAGTSRVLSTLRSGTRAVRCLVHICLGGETRHLASIAQRGPRGLTPPSSGRSKGRYAPFGPPLMSNVRRHEAGLFRQLPLRQGQIRSQG